jgi:hypothetical protein
MKFHLVEGRRTNQRLTGMENFLKALALLFVVPRMCFSFSRVEFFSLWRTLTISKLLGNQQHQEQKPVLDPDHLLLLVSYNLVENGSIIVYRIIIMHAKFVQRDKKKFNGCYTGFKGLAIPSLPWPGTFQQIIRS